MIFTKPVIKIDYLLKLFFIKDTIFVMIYLLLFCSIICLLFDLLQIVLCISIVNYIYGLYNNRHRLVRIFRSNIDIINICAICLESDSVCNIKLSCGHIFHQRCISDWTRINPVCPLCRSFI